MLLPPTRIEKRKSLCLRIDSGINLSRKFAGNPPHYSRYDCQYNSFTSLIHFHYYSAFVNYFIFFNRHHHFNVCKFFLFCFQWIFILKQQNPHTLSFLYCSLFIFLRILICSITCNCFTSASRYRNTLIFPNALSRF